MSSTSPAISRRRKKSSSRREREQEVFFRTTEAPGTIIIDTKGRFLYLVQGNNRALRYGIGVGRDGFNGPACRRFRASRNGRIAPPPEMIHASLICRGPWPEDRAIRCGRARCISGAPSTASPAPTSQTRLATRLLVGVFPSSQ